MKRPARQKLLCAVFAEAKKKGIDADFLREEIAPNVIRKRLSSASSPELIKILEHITGKNGKVKKYDSSVDGLVTELMDAARARWGEDFDKPLKAFINSHGFKGTLTHYSWMSVTDLKAFKERIKELNRQEGKEVIYAETGLDKRP